MGQRFCCCFQSVSTENAYSAQVNVAICAIYSLFLEYFKVWIKNSGDFSHYHPKITQFDWFLSVIEQKWLENHEISTLRTSPRMEGEQIPEEWNVSKKLSINRSGKQNRIILKSAIGTAVFGRVVIRLLRKQQNLTIVCQNLTGMTYL